MRAHREQRLVSRAAQGLHDCHQGRVSIVIGCPASRADILDQLPKSAHALKPGAHGEGVDAASHRALQRVCGVVYPPGIGRSHLQESLT